MFPGFSCFCPNLKCSKWACIWYIIHHLKTILSNRMSASWCFQRADADVVSLPDGYFSWSSDFWKQLLGHSAIFCQVFELVHYKKYRHKMSKNCWGAECYVISALTRHQRASLILMWLFVLLLFTLQFLWKWIFSACLQKMSSLLWMKIITIIPTAARRSQMFLKWHVQWKRKYILFFSFLHVRTFHGEKTSGSNQVLKWGKYNQQYIKY